MAKDRPTVELFTDGACTGNPGAGGWAYILKDAGGEVLDERSGGERHTTNNRMELQAVIEGLHALEGPSVVDLYSDSQYVVKGLSEWLDGWKAKGWRRGKNQSVKNEAQWRELDRLRGVHELRAHWIRGHSDHPENEACDRMAVAAIKLVLLDD